MTSELRREGDTVTLTIKPDASRLVASLQRLARYLAENGLAQYPLESGVREQEAARRRSRMHTAYRRRQVARRRRGRR